MRRCNPPHANWQARPYEVSELVAVTVRNFYLDPWYFKVKVPQMQVADRLVDARVRVINHHYSADTADPVFVRIRANLGGTLESQAHDRIRL